MFKKKKKISCVMLQDGLPNFSNDCCIDIYVDVVNKIVTFVEGKKVPNTCTLEMNKIIKVQSGTRNRIVNNRFEDVRTSLMTLIITYESDDEIKTINLYQANYKTAASLRLLEALLTINIDKSEQRNIKL